MGTERMGTGRGRCLALTAAIVGIGCSATYTWSVVQLDTEGEVVEVCNTTADEARRWMDVCRTLEGEVHVLDSGERCFYTGKVAASRQFEETYFSYGPTGRNECTGRGDFTCGLTGDGCPLEFVFQHLPPTE